jgi:NADH-quinone oxidoreductase subunit E
MSAHVVVTGEAFAFTPENDAWAKKQIAKYPEGRQASAVMPLLWRAQQQRGGWLSKEAIEYVADYLGMPYVRVLEVASFYTMYNLKPVGRHLVEVCTTTPCWLRGSDEVVKACKHSLGIGFNETTADGSFTLLEVECAGACVNAPVMAVDNRYYEDLNFERTTAVLDAFKKGETPKPGPQVNRVSSAPEGGATTLTEMAKGDA